jgi:hypothetical protein
MVPARLDLIALVTINTRPIIPLFDNGIKGIRLIHTIIE